jgi:arsenate reductase
VEKAKEMIEIYGLKNCDTCRKALKAFPEATLHDVRTDGVPHTLLSQAHDRFGSDLVNTRSTTWRGLDTAARALPPLEVLAQHPALMKRPLIVAGDTLFLGWSLTSEAEIRAAL